MQLIDTPALWHVRLASGGVAHIWADACAEENGHYVFQSLVRASLAEQTEVEMARAAPAGQGQVLIVVARFPEADVRDLHTALDGAYRPGCPCSSATDATD